MYIFITGLSSTISLQVLSIMRANGEMAELGYGVRLRLQSWHYVSWWGNPRGFESHSLHYLLHFCIFAFCPSGSSWCQICSTFVNNFLLNAFVEAPALHKVKSLSTQTTLAVLIGRWLSFNDNPRPVQETRRSSTFRTWTQASFIHLLALKDPPSPHLSLSLSLSCSEMSAESIIDTASPCRSASRLSTMP